VDCLAFEKLFRFVMVTTIEQGRVWSCRFDKVLPNGQLLEVRDLFGHSGATRGGATVTWQYGLPIDK